MEDMKKFALIFASFVFVSPAMADDILPNTNIVTSSYVLGAYNALDDAKQEKLTSAGNNANIVVDTNTASLPLVSGISASNGTVTVTKADVTIPVNSSGSTTGRANIWVE